MSTHTVHPSILVGGLNDDCARCTEHAAHPIRSLDRERLGHYLRMATGVGDAKPQTRNDERAVAEIRDALNLVGALWQAAPATVVAYLAEHWSTVS